MINPNNDLQFRRLRESIEVSRNQLGVFREKRTEHIRQFVGHNYSDNGSDNPVPVNYIEMATHIYSRNLISQNPKVLVTTTKQQLKPKAYTLGLALDHLIDEIKLSETLLEVVMDALFSVGLIKVGISNIATFPFSDDITIDATQPFAESIDLDDWVQDMRAKHWRNSAYCGNKYRVVLEEAKESNAFNKSVRSKLTVEHRGSYSETGEEQTEMIAQGSIGRDREDLEDMVELWDIWLPREKLLVTMQLDGLAEPLRVVEWEGPEQGPYRRLGYLPVPGNSMPLSMISVISDIHDLANVIYNKLGRQASRQKTIGAVGGAASEDAKRMVSASDGEWVSVMNPENIQEVKLGGIDQQNLSFGIHLRDLAGYFGGNLDALGGLSPQSETLGQDRLLTAAASKRLDDMQERTIVFVREVLRDLGWYLWTDPLIDLVLTKRPRGTDIEIPVRFTEEEKEGDILDYNIGFEPYSMRSSPPRERLDTLMQLFQSLINPLAPMLEQQGLTVNFEELIRLVAKYSNVPELLEIIQFSGQPLGDRTGIVQPGQQGGNRQTEHVRRNVAQSTPRGHDQVMQRILSGAGVQNGESESLFRQTG